MATNVSYETLMNEITKLRKQADILRVNDVIAEIRAQVEEFGLTPQDIFGEDVPFTKKGEKIVHTRKKPEPKFVDPNTGATWTGRGKTPKWMKGTLSSGGSKDDFAIK